jgi:hypothetical protein
LYFRNEYVLSANMSLVSISSLKFFISRMSADKTLKCSPEVQKDTCFQANN